jgi:hypothetical protein
MLLSGWDLGVAVDRVSLLLQNCRSRLNIFPPPDGLVRGRLEPDKPAQNPKRLKSVESHVSKVRDVGHPAVVPRFPRNQNTNGKLRLLAESKKGAQQFDNWLSCLSSKKRMSKCSLVANIFEKTLAIFARIPLTLLESESERRHKTTPLTVSSYMTCAR